MNTHQKINIIADNAGGITLQIIGGETDYQHFFISGKAAVQAVYDAIVAKKGNGADDIHLRWENNDLDYGEELLNVSAEEENNGAYYIIEDVQSFHDVLAHEGVYGFNVNEVVDGVYALVMEDVND